jgi:FixJ family two-component response regulator
VPDSDQPGRCGVTGPDNLAPLVAIVDDDPGICAAIADLLRSVGLETCVLTSTGELLAAEMPDRPGCIVLDVRLPGGNGLDLQLQLRSRGVRLPIVFLTGFGDIPMSVRAMKAGAVDFLTKPVRDQDLLDAVMKAIEQDRRRRVEDLELAVVTDMAARLTPREREVAAAVSQGLMNKQIAFELGISEITVKLHRGNAMHKLEARSIADFIRKVEQAGLCFHRSAGRSYT